MRASTPCMSSPHMRLCELVTSRRMNAGSGASRAFERRQSTGCASCQGRRPTGNHDQARAGSDATDLAAQGTTRAHGGCGFPDLLLEVTKKLADAD
jgi:hypothetical protein